MHTSTDLTTRLAALRDLADEIAGAESLPTLVSGLDDDAVVALARIATALGQAAERVHVVAAGVIGARSSRSAGHSGLAQSRGHRSAVALLQHVTGGTRGEAVRQLRVGESLFDEGPDRAGFDTGVGRIEASGTAECSTEDPVGGSAGWSSGQADTLPLPWHAPLRAALMSGTISTAQHDAIRRGLGEPPTAPTDASTDPAGGEYSPPSPTMSVPASLLAAPNAAAVQAWSLAAERLIAEAEQVTVEELAKQARAIRDLLDPEGAEARFLARYEARSFRMWVDAEGLTHGSFVFDDESAAWLRSVIDTALRPRRGGPRFVDPAEQAAAEELVNDPRTNEQLSHDLLIDVLKSGTLADAEAVLGARQAGVRIVQIVNRDDYLATQAARQRTLPGRAGGQHRMPAHTVTRFEDDGTTLPATAAAQQQCNSGIVAVIADAAGNPLNVGREQRLYTPKQRIALAIRDGGCRWNGCDRPASYCEAHHIDEWAADRGRTDIDRGILLCRFHHMQLHHGGWRITRRELGPFLLHTPPVGRTPRSTGRIPRSEGRIPRTAGRTVPPEARSLSPEGRAPSPDGRTLSPDRRTLSPEGNALPSDGKALSPDARPQPDPIELRPRLPLSYGWQHATPPPKRFRSAA